MSGFNGNQVRHSQVATRARAVLAIQNFIETPDKLHRIYSSLTLLLPASPDPSPPVVRGGKTASFNASLMAFVAMLILALSIFLFR
jgi:hypothetical protein